MSALKVDASRVSWYGWLSAVPFNLFSLNNRVRLKKTYWKDDPDAELPESPPVKETIQSIRDDDISIWSHFDTE